MGFVAICSLLNTSLLNHSFSSAELTITLGKNWWKTYQCCGFQTWCLSHYGHASIFVTFSSYFLKTLGLKEEAGERLCSFSNVLLTLAFRLCSCNGTRSSSAFYHMPVAEIGQLQSLPVTKVRWVC
jgi:hypothetical protein